MKEASARVQAERVKEATKAKGAEEQKEPKIEVVKVRCYGCGSLQ